MTKATTSPTTTIDFSRKELECILAVLRELKYEDVDNDCTPILKRKPFAEKRSKNSILNEIREIIGSSMTGNKLGKKETSTLSIMLFEKYLSIGTASLGPEWQVRKDDMPSAIQRALNPTLFESVDYDTGNRIGGKAVISEELVTDLGEMEAGLSSQESLAFYARMKLGPNHVLAMYIVAEEYDDPDDSPWMFNSNKAVSFIYLESSEVILDCQPTICKKAINGKPCEDVLDCRVEAFKINGALNPFQEANIIHPMNYMVSTCHPSLLGVIGVGVDIPIVLSEMPDKSMRESLYYHDY